MLLLLMVFIALAAVEAACEDKKGAAKCLAKANKGKKKKINVSKYKKAANPDAALTAAKAARAQADAAAKKTAEFDAEMDKALEEEE